MGDPCSKIVENAPKADPAYTYLCTQGRTGQRNTRIRRMTQ